MPEELPGQGRGVLRPSDPQPPARDQAQERMHLHLVRGRKPPPKALLGPLPHLNESGHLEVACICKNDIGVLLEIGDEFLGRAQEKLRSCVREGV